MFRALFAIAVLGCSAAENGAPQRQELGGSSGQGGAAGSPQNPEGGQAGETTTGGKSGSTSSGGAGPELCSEGETRTCSCAPGYSGEQGCYGTWLACICADWPPSEGGAGGTGPEPWLGRDCQLNGPDTCSAGAQAPIRKGPVCMPDDGLVGGEGVRPGYCTFVCESGTVDAEACSKLGGACGMNLPTEPGEPVVSHCIPE